MSPVREVPCPHCRQPSLFAPANPYRPFCSARCREQDLGDWGNERFRIAAPPPEVDDEGHSAAPVSPNPHPTA